MEMRCGCDEDGENDRERKNETILTHDALFLLNVIMSSIQKHYHPLKIVSFGHAMEVRV